MPAIASSCQSYRGRSCWSASRCGLVVAATLGLWAYYGTAVFFEVVRAGWARVFLMQTRRRPDDGPNISYFVGLLRFSGRTRHFSRRHSFYATPISGNRSRPVGDRRAVQTDR